MNNKVTDIEKTISELPKIKLYTASNVCEGRLTEETVSLELSENQFYILKILSNRSPFKLSNLAKALMISNATCRKIIHKLVVKKLVRRRFRKKGRRTTMISITPKGQETVARDNNLIIEKFNR